MKLILSWHLSYGKIHENIAKSPTFPFSLKSVQQKRKWFIYIDRSIEREREREREREGVCVCVCVHSHTWYVLAFSILAEYTVLSILQIEPTNSVFTFQIQKQHTDALPQTPCHHGILIITFLCLYSSRSKV